MTNSKLGLPVLNHMESQNKYLQATFFYIWHKYPVLVAMTYQINNAQKLQNNKNEHLHEK